MAMQKDIQLDRQRDKWMDGKMQRVTKREPGNNPKRDVRGNISDYSH